jgi:hypothetical protein
MTPETTDTTGTTSELREPGRVAAGVSHVLWWLPELVTAGALALIGLALWWPAALMSLAVIPWIAVHEAKRVEINNRTVAAATAAPKTCPCDRLVAECVRLDRESVTPGVCVFQAEEVEEV